MSTGYHVKVLYAFSFDEVAKLVRRLAEWRHNESPVRGERRKRGMGVYIYAHSNRLFFIYAYLSSQVEWNGNRDWLKEDFTKQELFLISFPCINSFR